MIKLIIALHGYGSNGQDLEFIGKIFKNEFSDIEFLNPDAPFKNAYQQNAFEWFPIEEVEENHFLGGIRVVYPIFEDYLLSAIETFKVKAEEVIVSGFSQGGCLAIHTGLHFKEKLGGVISFSGGFINPNNIIEDEIANKPNILLIHGKDDEILPSHYSEKANYDLTKFNVPVELKLIDKLGHKINSECINSAIEFIREINAV